MAVFVSGATGFIGIQLVKRLVERGFVIHALYRSELKADLIRMREVHLYKGDILDESTLVSAMIDCTEAYHVAAFAGVWSTDPGMIFRLNVEGALNVINAAKKTGIRRVVLTSTAGILGPSEKVPVNEYSPPPSSFFTPYETSKFQLEQYFLGVKSFNPEVIIVNPTRVYGPGYMSESNGVTKMIKQYMEGKWRFIPGTGIKSGNYVFVEDVVSGHILAMEKGVAGERYILAGENISYNQLFQYIRESSGVKKRLYKIPLRVMLIVAALMKLFSKITGRQPMIVPDLVRKFNHNWLVTSDKAIHDLGYDPMGGKDGIERTVNWIRSQTIS